MKHKFKQILKFVVRHVATCTEPFNSPSLVKHVQLEAEDGTKIELRNVPSDASGDTFVMGKEFILSHAEPIAEAAAVAATGSPAAGVVAGAAVRSVAARRKAKKKSK